MLYGDLVFRGDFMLKERRRVERQRLTAASFGAWQSLQAHADKLPTWPKYLRQLGLSDEPEVTKADLKREADQAMENAQRIIEKLRGANAGR